MEYTHESVPVSFAKKSFLPPLETGFAGDVLPILGAVYKISFTCDSDSRIEVEVMNLGISLSFKSPSTFYGELAGHII